ncbi:phosphatidylinositol kinase [Virgisporangium aliadipatigenens]|uniref:Phosphatidylinositol kinase n=1 Tax=Virgisporangium aliadipatigenens TaxID=741659 RepID=A0A8J3YLP0_9ACTN|nr:SCO1664 family protein [Virgisporangium aliadipatigenens]GIJ46597.1 phosphatidylinositol kinase [Virgisporangium aliadipatigenens]
MPGIPTEDALDILNHGTIEIEGRLVDASNATLRAVITLDRTDARCVYKPVRGERPLWDFPDGTLAGREYGSYLVSEATGWSLVPPTVLRVGPLGWGMVQLWIDEERQSPEPLVNFVPRRKVPPGWHRIAAAQDDDGRPFVLAHSDDAKLARMAVFDAVVNNADRKGGHVLSTVDGEVFGVDHGLTFHADDKLRTVLWGWSGDALPAEATEALAKLRAGLDGGLGEALAEHLTITELRVLCERIDRLEQGARFPKPNPDWPALPWPPI